MSYWEEAEFSKEPGWGEEEEEANAEEEAEEEERAKEEARAEAKTRAMCNGFAALWSMARENCWPLLNRAGADLRWAKMMRELE